MEPELMFAMHQDRVREAEQAITRRQLREAVRGTAPRRSRTPVAAVLASAREQARAHARARLATWSRTERPGAAGVCCAPA